MELGVDETAGTTCAAFWLGSAERVAGSRMAVCLRCLLRRWAAARSAVSGRFVNAYSSNDWVLGVVFRWVKELLRARQTAGRVVRLRV